MGNKKKIAVICSRCGKIIIGKLDSPFRAASLCPGCYGIVERAPYLTATCPQCGHVMGEHRASAGCEHEDTIDGDIIICSCMRGV